MNTERRSWPVLLAAGGAAGLLISLWLHWYAFTIPTAAIDQADQMASQFGALAPLIHQGAAIARNLGELHLTAWQALQQIDIVLAGLAGVAGAVALMSGAERAGSAVGLAGAVALALCAYRTIVPPGPSGLLHPALGAYVALGASAAILLGGWLLGGREAVSLAPLEPLSPFVPLSARDPLLANDPLPAHEPFPAHEPLSSDQPLPPHQSRKGSVAPPPP